MSRMKIHDDSLLDAVDGTDGFKNRSSGNLVDNGQTSSASTAVDPEFGHTNFGDNDDGYRDDNTNGFEHSAIVHKTAFSQRKCKAACICLTVVFALFILVQVAFSSGGQPAKQERCDTRLSAPYTNNRSVNTELCIAHSEPNWRNAELTDFLLPVERATSKYPVKFLVLGDFGRDGWCAFICCPTKNFDKELTMTKGCQRDVALEMERAANTIDANFLINTGDAFYDGGIEKVTDEQVKTSFLNVYNQPKVKSLEFYSVLGNHEYRGSPSAVLQIPGRHQRFAMDGRWYAKTFRSVGNAYVQLIFIDTSPMIESYKIPGYDSGTNIMLKRPDGISSQWAKVQEQLDWIERRLQNERFNFSMRIVVGHHPLYDYSSHQGEDRSVLQKNLAPLLERYNVTAYFAGHDHSLQFVQMKKGSVAHFVSGAGSKISPSGETHDTPESAIQFYYVKNGFMACSAYDDELRVAVVDIEGKVLDTAVVRARKDAM